MVEVAVSPQVRLVVYWSSVNAIRLPRFASGDPSAHRYGAKLADGLPLSECLHDQATPHALWNRGPPPSPTLLRKGTCEIDVVRMILSIRCYHR